MTKILLHNKGEIMKLILSTLFLMSFTVHSKEISQKAFLKAAYANRDTLGRLNVGMSAKEVLTVTNSANFCDNSVEYCFAYKCEYEVTKMKTIIAINKKQHYVHIQESTINLTQTPECELTNSNDVYLALQNNEITHMTLLNLNNITKIEMENSKIYKLYSQFSYGNYKSTSVSTYDFSRPLFYALVEMKFNATNSNFTMVNEVNDYKDPKSFDLRNIKLCDLSTNQAVTKCNPEQNFSFLIK